MVVYHGTPMGGTREGVTRFLWNRHALVPFSRTEDLAVALEVCQTVVADNGAFTAWKSGNPVSDWRPYYDWIDSFYRHPSFRWAIIPDVIDGTEKENDDLLNEWPEHLPGIPVFHLHESFSRLRRLIKYGWLCLGSSGKFSKVGTKVWHRRMNEIMEVICDPFGYPKSNLHGLRMADPRIVEKYPFSSVDSTNAARNSSSTTRPYIQPQRWQRAECIARRMEEAKSPATYVSKFCGIPV